MTECPPNPPIALGQFLPDEPADMLRTTAFRYGVAENVIVHLAPVVFHIVAQASLTRRRAALERLAAAHRAISEAGEAFLLHGAGMFPEDRFSEAHDAEMASIVADDILGQRIADESGSLAESATGPEAASFATRNPLATYIGLLASDVIGELRLTDRAATYRPIRQPVVG